MAMKLEFQRNETKLGLQTDTEVLFLGGKNCAT